MGIQSWQYCQSYVFVKKLEHRNKSDFYNTPTCRYSGYVYGTLIYHETSASYLGCGKLVFTARKQVWGKVMFLHLPVSHSVHSGHQSGRYAS